MTCEFVKLTAAELAMCADMGARRYKYAKDHNCNGGAGIAGRTENAVFHIRGCETEYAGSIMLNMSWRPTIGEFGGKDVGGLVEVRSTMLPHGRLPVRPFLRNGKPATGPCVLVIKNGDNEFLWGGWRMAEYAIENYPLISEYGDPAHFVPQTDLLDMKSLVEWARDK